MIRPGLLCVLVKVGKRMQVALGVELLPLLGSSVFSHEESRLPYCWSSPLGLGASSTGGGLIGVYLATETLLAQVPKGVVSHLVGGLEQ